MSDDRELPNLGTRAPDVAASAIRGIGGIIMPGGRFVASIVATLVPGQRSIRVDRYLEILDQRLVNIEEEQRRIIASSPEHIDLIEEGAFRAARALNERRIDRIAYTVAVGMTKGSADIAAEKRLLTIFSDLDEQDIIVLKWYIERNRVSADDYVRNHNHLFDFDKLPVTSFSPKAEREADALRKAIDIKLFRFGLVEENEEKDPAGFPNRKSDRITELGQLILRTAGVLDDDGSREENPLF